MAIRIMKPGKPNLPRFEGKCLYCGCMFLCDEEDIKPSSALARQKENIYGSVKCPQEGCEEKVTIYEY